jgi:fatty acid desaturase
MPSPAKIRRSYLRYQPLDLAWKVVARLRRAWVGSGRLMAVRMLLDSSKAWAALVALWTLAAAFLPILLLVAMGAVVGSVPSAAHHSLGSPEGRHLVIAVLVAGAFFAATLLLGPLQTTEVSVC